MAFLRCCYHQILEPRRHLPKFSDGLCRHAGACVRFNTHFGWQAAESYVERSNAFRGTIERRDERARSLFDHLVGCHSRNETLLNARLHQSALAPENFTTMPHFSISCPTSFPNSADEPRITVLAKSAKRAFILGSARPALISLLSLPTISLGVFFGAAMPYQAVAS